MKEDMIKTKIQKTFPDLIPSELVGCKPMGTKEDLIFAINYFQNKLDEGFVMNYSTGYWEKKC